MSARTEIDNLTIKLMQRLNGKIMPVKMVLFISFLSSRPSLPSVNELLKFMNHREDLDRNVRVSQRRIAPTLVRAHENLRNMPV